jgi:hypothetical protein
MTNTTALKQKIVDLIAELTDYFQTGSVYSYEPEVGEVDFDPWCFVIDESNETDFFSTCENKRRFVYKVRIAVERNSRTPKSAEALIILIRDAIIDKLDANYTLGGEALISKADPTSVGYILSEKEYRIFDLKVTADVVFDITS